MKEKSKNQSSYNNNSNSNNNNVHATYPINHYGNVSQGNVVNVSSLTINNNFNVNSNNSEFLGKNIVSAQQNLDTKANSNIFNAIGEFHLLVNYEMTIPKGQTVRIGKSEDDQSLPKISILTFEDSGALENNSGKLLKIDTLKIGNTTKYMANCDDILKITVDKNGNCEIVGREFYNLESNDMSAAGACDEYIPGYFL